MPINRYLCSICGSDHDTLEQAVACENLGTAVCHEPGDTLQFSVVSPSDLKEDTVLSSLVLFTFHALHTDDDGSNPRHQAHYIVNCGLYEREVWFDDSGDDWPRYVSDALAAHPLGYAKRLKTKAVSQGLDPEGYR